MNTEPYAKEIEDALDRELKDLGKPPKANGPIGPSKVTLAVELDQVIDSMQTRIRQMEQIKAAVEAMKASL